MPPKICGKCSKTVYPTEELKCLDKVWHKGCFKCQECNMTLNMKNYKGYNKLPYCNAHYPTTKHTVVADTPENRRITKNTQIQSNIKYHEDFEKAKGSKISVAADPETERIKKTMQTISNVSYHGELEKKMEQESHRPSHAVEVAGEPAVNDEPPSSEPHQSGYRAYNYEPQQQQQQHGIVTMNQPHRRQPGSISNYDPMSQESVYTSSPYSNQRVGTRVYSSSQASEPQPRTRRVGSIADYDPVNEQFGSIAGQYTAPPPEAAPAPPTEQYREPSPPPVQYREPSPPPVQYREPSPPPVQYREPSPPPVQYREPSPPPQQSYREPSPPPVETYYREPSPPPEPSSPLPAADMFARSISQPPQEESIDEAQPSYGGNRGRSGLVCRAIYDYTAADTDEVSFTEGDCIVNCQVIDEGWMTGVVQRTGRQGMLPSNYVEPINQ